MEATLGRKYIERSLLMFNSIKALVTDRKGVTALEYGVVAAVTVVIIAASFTALTAPFAALMGRIVAAL